MRADGGPAFARLRQTSDAVLRSCTAAKKETGQGRNCQINREVNSTVTLGAKGVINN
jgi:hypothetical protein